jgi:hypothetical protein
VSDERFMRHHYGASGFVDKQKAEEHRCPACGNTKIPKPESLARKELLEKLVHIAVQLDPASHIRKELEKIIHEEKREE